MSSREKIKNLISSIDTDLYRLNEIYIFTIEDKNFITYSSVHMLKYTNIIKDNDFDLNSRIVINALVDLILTAYDILMYTKDMDHETCKEIVIKIINKILDSWRQVVTNVDNKLIIKTLIEKMIMKGRCSKNMIHMSI